MLSNTSYHITSITPHHHIIISYHIYHITSYTHDVRYAKAFPLLLIDAALVLTTSIMTDGGNMLNCVTVEDSQGNERTVNNKITMYTPRRKGWLFCFSSESTFKNVWKIKCSFSCRKCWNTDFYREYQVKNNFFIHNLNGSSIKHISILL